MTDEEYEEAIDKMYDKLDQYQAEMEELGLIMYGDRAYYIMNPEEYEKDKRICELESKIERLEYLLGIKEKAFDLMSIVLCTEARNDLKKQICKFGLRVEVKKFFEEQAKKEIGNGKKN